MTGVVGTFVRATLALGLLVTVVTAAPPASAEQHRTYRSYMAFGDSLTVGTGTSAPETKSYPAQADVRAYGVEGACVVENDCGRGHYNALDWWPVHLETLDNLPSVAVFEIGINDIAYSHADEIVAGLRGLRRLGRDRDIRVVFGTITPAPLDDPYRAGEAVRREVNRWIRKQNDHVEYARPLQCERRTLCPQFVSPEREDVHLSDAGAAVMAEQLLAWIEADRKA